MCARVCVRAHACTFIYIYAKEAEHPRRSDIDVLDDRKNVEAFRVLSSRHEDGAYLWRERHLHREEISQKERRARHDSLFRVCCNSAVLQTHTHALPPFLFLSLTLSLSLARSLFHSLISPLTRFLSLSHTLSPLCASRSKQVTCHRNGASLAAPGATVRQVRVLRRLADRRKGAR